MWFWRQGSQSLLWLIYIAEDDSDTDTDSNSCLLSFTEVAIRDSSPSLCNVNKLTVNGTKSSEALHLDLGVIHV